MMLEGTPRRLTVRAVEDAEPSSECLAFTSEEANGWQDSVWFRHGVTSCHLQRAVNQLSRFSLTRSRLHLA